jgi:hypothetical protein
VDNRTPLFALLAVAVVFVLALAVFGSGSETIAETTTTFADVDIPDPPLTTTTAPRAVEVTPRVLTTDLAVPTPPGLERLVIVTGQSPAGRLRVVDPTDEIADVRLPSGASDFQIDSSGGALAFLDGDRALRITTLDGTPIATPGGISQFVWSGDEALAAVWFDEGDGTEQTIVLGRVEDDTLVATERFGTVSEPGAVLRGATAAGWWVTYQDPAVPRTTLSAFHPRSGDPGWITPADLVVPPASGARALLGKLDISSWSWNFGLGAGDLRPLEWAPGDANGERGFAAFSPTGVQVAFIGNDERALGWLEIQSTSGGPTQRLTLPYRVWDVRWSQRGDYVLMPGTDLEGTTHVVLAVDARISSNQETWVYAIEVDDRVQFATAIDMAHRTTSETGPAGA